MTAAPDAYPRPPWRMHGEAYFSPYLVDRTKVSLPAGFELVHPGRFTVGVFGIVRYLPPSPLVYDELVFMPCFVRAPRFGPRARGWYVSVMYVSETHTLRGGREIWKLPKTLASFEFTTRTCKVRANDGTELGVEFASRGPTVNAPARISTLQYNDGVSLCRFRSKARASFGAASMRVTDFSTNAPAWGGFDPSRRVPLPAVTQQDFVADMLIPTFLRQTS